MKAFEWFTKSAGQGDAEGQINLGECYEKGKGVAKDEKKSFEWHTKSAEQGNAYGQFKLGWFHRDGIGVAKDVKKAFEWYSKSAEQGNATGQICVGYCYSRGIGVTKDEKEAVKWYTKAAEEGEPHGLSNIAWIYATSNDPSMRNGKEALKFAQQAVQKCVKPDSYIYAALAAAYAEQGDFKMAVATQEKAISILTNKTREKDYQDELNEYKNKKPWRDNE
jgi:TPR repeat protein